MKKRRSGIVFLLAVSMACAGVAAFANDVPVTPTGVVALAVPSSPAPTFAIPEGKTFFPHNWLRGYTDFEVAPSHNEPDLGRCSQSSAANFGGANSNCNAYARYLLGGYLEIQPFGKTFLRHGFVFFTPTFSLGNNVPQFKYTASASGIAFERSVGLGITLPKNFEIRVTQHQVDWLGKYKHNVGPADLGTSGPYGLYTTIGARWYFGGYGRAKQAQ